LESGLIAFQKNTKVFECNQRLSFLEIVA
jgi:hypothetical protein